MRYKNDMNIENIMVMPMSRRRREHEVRTVDEEEVRRAAVRATERRLRNIPAIRRRIEDEREMLSELENLGIEGMRHVSSSFVSMIRPGMRIDEEDAYNAQVAYLRSRLACDEHELKVLAAALEEVKDDSYFKVIDLYYCQGINDPILAERMHCDKSTIHRHRRAMVEKLAARLYGAI